MSKELWLGCGPFLHLEKVYKVAKITEVWHFNKDCPNSKAPPNAQIWRMAHVYPLWPTPSQDSFWAISHAHSLHLSLGLLIKWINLVCFCQVNGTQHMHRNGKKINKCLNQYLHSRKYFNPFLMSLEGFVLLQWIRPKMFLFFWNEEIFHRIFLFKWPA